MEDTKHGKNAGLKGSLSVTMRRSIPSETLATKSKVYAKRDGLMKSDKFFRRRGHINLRNWENWRKKIEDCIEFLHPRCRPAKLENTASEVRVQKLRNALVFGAMSHISNANSGIERKDTDGLPRETRRATKDRDGRNTSEHAASRELP